MQGIIANLRSSRHRQSGNQMIVLPKGISNREKAAALKGRKAVFKTETGKEITGTVSSAHGNKGAVRVIFEKGMPGQSLSEKVEIQ